MGHQWKIMENQLTIIENHWLPDCTWEGGWDRRAGRYYVWWWSMWIPLKPFGRGSLFHTFSTYLLGRTFGNNRCLSVSVSPIHLGCVFTEPLPMNSTVWTPILGDSVLYCWYTFIFPGFISKSLAVNRIAYSTPRCFLNGYPKVCQAGSVPKVVSENLHPQVCWSSCSNYLYQKEKEKRCCFHSPSFSNPPLLTSFDYFLWYASKWSTLKQNGQDRIFNGTVESRLMSSAAHDCLCQAVLGIESMYFGGKNVFYVARHGLNEFWWIFTCPMDA